MTAPVETATAVMVQLAERATAWLDEANGRIATELHLRCYKPVEEYGEVCEALLHHEPEQAVREAVDVIAAALTARFSLGYALDGWSLPYEAAADEVSWSLVQRRVLQVGAEVGVLTGVMIGEAGQNPRKGRTKSIHDVIAQLDAVVEAAVRLIAALGVDPERAVVEHASRVLVRLDELGVSA